MKAKIVYLLITHIYNTSEKEDKQNEWIGVSLDITRHCICENSFREIWLSRSVGRLS